MGCGASSKADKYKKKGSHQAEKDATSAKVHSEAWAKTSSQGSKNQPKMGRIDSGASVSTRASSKSSNSSKGDASWHVAHCTDTDLSMVKTINDAYPFNNDKRKSVDRKNSKSHGGGYADVTVADMGPKQINCKVCGVFVLGRYDTQPFYYCMRCRTAGHRCELCVDCFDQGCLATGPRKKMAVVCKTQAYSYTVHASACDKPEHSFFSEAIANPCVPNASPRPTPKDEELVALDDGDTYVVMPVKKPRPSPRGDALPATVDSVTASVNRRRSAPALLVPQGATETGSRSTSKNTACSNRAGDEHHSNIRTDKSPRPSPRPPKPSPRDGETSLRASAVAVDNRRSAPALLVPAAAGDGARSASKNSNDSNPCNPRRTSWSNHLG